VFSTNLFLTVVKSLLAKMLAKKGVVDNQTNGYNEDKRTRTIWNSKYRGGTGGSCKSRPVHFWGRSEIRKIKQQDYTFDRWEYDPESLLVAAPVYGYSRWVMDSLAIGAPPVRTSGMKLRNLTSTTLDIAAEISGDIGYRVPANREYSGDQVQRNRQWRKEHAHDYRRS
jgi:hypothetical protein